MELWRTAQRSSRMVELLGRAARRLDRQSEAGIKVVPPRKVSVRAKTKAGSH